MKLYYLQLSNNVMIVTQSIGDARKRIAALYSEDIAQDAANRISAADATELPNGTYEGENFSLYVGEQCRAPLALIAKSYWLRHQQKKRVKKLCQIAQSLQKRPIRR